MRPQRPYKNVTEFRNSGHDFIVLDRSGIEWPCLHCRGRKWVFAPGSEPDVIEGNKLRDRVKCHPCGGTGKGSRQAILKAYSEVINRWKRRAKAYDEAEAIRKVALAKLTKEEILALGL